MAESREKIAWKDYHWFSLGAAYFFSWLIGTYLEFLTKRISPRGKLVGLEAVPDNAILYSFHHDVMTNYLTMTRLAQLRPGHLVRWIGFHGFFGYFTFHCGTHDRYRSIRYDKKQRKSARDQIVELMGQTPDCRIGIFTDYGTRGRVNGSLGFLSLQSNRPLVPMRSLGDRVGKLLSGDQLPHLGTTVTSVFGRAIFPETLKKLTPEQQQGLLQREIEAISP